MFGFISSAFNSIGGMVSSIFNVQGKKQEKISEAIKAMAESNSDSADYELKKLQIAQTIIASTNSSTPLAVFRSTALFMFLGFIVFSWFGISPAHLDATTLNDIWVAVITTVGVSIPAISAEKILDRFSNNKALREIISPPF